MQIISPEKIGKFNKQAFPVGVLRESEDWTLKDEVFLNRRRVRGVTIDPIDRQDIDDAVWLDFSSNIVTVSVADVDALLIPNSYTDRIRAEKVFSRYFANSKRPIMPLPLENRLNLWGGEIRPTVSAVMQLDSQGVVESVQFERTYLINERELSYPDADQLISTSEDEHGVMLRGALALAEQWREARRSAGAMIIEDNSAGWRIGDTGRLRQAPELYQSKSDVVVHEFMVMANTQVAQTLAPHGYGLFRNHAMAATFDERQALVNEINEQIATGQPLSPRRYQTILQRMGGRAHYGILAEGHDAMGLRAYTHWTSPIRRHPDVIVNRALFSLLQGEPFPYSPAELQDFAEHASTVEQLLKGLDVRSNRRRSKAVAPIRDRERGTIVEKSPEQALPVRRDYSSLTANTFYKYALQAVQQGSIDETLRNELIRRTQTGELNAQIMHLILLEEPAGQDPRSSEADIWKALRAQVIEGLFKDPEPTNRVLDYARWSGDLHSLDVQTRFNPGPLTTYDFTARGTFRTRTEEIRAKIDVDSKTRAGIFARLSLLSKFADVDPSDHLRKPLYLKTGPVDAEVFASPQLVRESTGATDALFKSCHVLHSPDPQFVVLEEKVVENRPVFVMQGQIEVMDEVFRTLRVTAMRLSDARAVASRELVGKLSTRFPIFKAQVDRVLAAQTKVNYKGELMSLVQQRRFNAPRFERSSTQNEHTIVGQLTIRGQTFVTHAFTAPSVKEAERLASEELLRLLSDAGITQKK